MVPREGERVHAVLASLNVPPPPTSGAFFRSPVKANVFMRFLQASTSFFSTRFSRSRMPTLARRSTQPLLITGCVTYTCGGGGAWVGEQRGE